MKQLLFVITLVLALLVCATSIAQNGINYKALIKDVSGNILTSTLVDIQFIIYEGSALTNNVYQESHTVNTDINGLVVLNIGEGTTGDVFTDITWGSDDHFLNVQVNTGSGLVDLGTTEFRAVPYALNAANVSGLEALDEGNGIGYRLLNANSIYYGNIGSRAVDLSYGGDSGFDGGQGAIGLGSVAMGQYTTANVGSVAMGYGTSATGQYATAMGSNTIASGPFTVAMGESSTASGLYATAIGFNTDATGQTSTAMGLETEASGQNSTAMGNATNAVGENSFATGELTSATGKTSTAMGNGTNANGLLSTAIGRFNLGGGSPTTWVNTDPLFEIGNGSGFGSKANALTVLKNGSITAPSFDMAEITDNKSLITKEYADTNYSGGGSTGLEAINEGSGTGWRLIGANPNNFGVIGWSAMDLSIQEFSSTTRGATAPYAVVLGYGTTASANHSTAMGYLSIASGMYSTAMGYSADATGENATAIGFETNAQGDYSIALGNSAWGLGNNSAAIGEGVIADDANSMAVGVFNDPNVFANTVFQVGNGTLAVGSNAFTVFQNGDAILAGTLAQSSDRRLKKDIQDLEYGLNEILALQPKSYHWKKRTTNSKSLGLIAQDVQSILKEIVHATEDKEKILSISYIELIPVLIKAIQEQQQIIELQNSNIEAQGSANTDQNKLIETMMKRISALEAINNH